MNQGMQTPQQQALCDQTQRRLDAVTDELFGLSDAIISKIERLSPMQWNISKESPTAGNEPGFLGSINDRIDSLHKIKDRLYATNENLTRIIG